MKYKFISTAFLASLTAAMQDPAFASCDLVSSASAELNTSLFFDGARDAIPFRPFTIEDSHGNPLPKEKTALLSLPAAEEEQRLDAMKKRERALSESGFEISSSLCDSSFADRILSVGEYEREMNEAEKKLNGLGYSLRAQDAISVLEKQRFNSSRLDEQVVQAAEVYTGKANALYNETIDKVEAKYEEIKQQYGQISQKAKDLKVEDLYVEGERHKCEAPVGGGFSATNSECFLNELEDPGMTEVNPLADPNVNDCKSDTPLGKAYLLNESWTDAGGDRNFGWTGQASFKLQTDARGLFMDGNTKIDGLVLNKTVKIVKGEAQFVAPRTGRATGKLTLEIVGSKVLNEKQEWDISLVDSKDQEGKQRYWVHKEQRLYSTTIPIGFVPVLLMIDSKVSAGPTYGLNLAPVKIWGKAEWTQSASIMASAGIGADLKVFVVLAGVKGSIELVNFALGVYPEAGLYLDDKHRPVLNARMWAGSKLRTLAGALNLGVWAQTTFAIPVTKSDFPFIEMKPLTYEWSKQLGNYPGYDFPQAVLFDKQIGYDICTGRKTVNTLVEVKPRAIDQRESLEIQESVRVSKLENDLIIKLDELLYADKTLSAKREGDKELTAISALKPLRTQTTIQVLGHTLSP